jgi:hypothetical protein
VPQLRNDVVELDQHLLTSKTKFRDFLFDFWDFDSIEVKEKTLEKVYDVFDNKLNFIDSQSNNTYFEECNTGIIDTAIFLMSSVKYDILKISNEEGVQTYSLTWLRVKLYELIYSLNEFNINVCRSAQKLLYKINDITKCRHSKSKWCPFKNHVVSPSNKNGEYGFSHLLMRIWLPRLTAQITNQKEELHDVQRKHRERNTQDKGLANTLIPRGTLH